jgi:LacI family transcriptional regulator
MSSRFTHKEIAHQAGLSLATVDRVLHGRAHVSLATKDRLHAALQELEQQYTVSPLRQTRVMLDIVMQAPERFSSAVRAAFEAELPLVRPATFRARFHLAEVMREAEITALLRAIGKRGSQGVVLKAPATPAIETCLAELAARKIPVVSYVTDVSAEFRLAYVGMQNHHAGATAAYLLAKMAPKQASRVLVTLSSAGFEGEEARGIGFCRALATYAPYLAVTTVSEGFGVDRATGSLIDQALAEHPDIASVYSIGGGNRAILDAFATANRPIEVFAAHDLDRTNRHLLKTGQISFVIHHSLRHDARRVALHFSKHYRLIAQDIQIEDSEISIACPVF